MSCQEIERNLYLYAELTETEKREVDNHLTTCSSCREVWAAIVDSQQKIKTVAFIRPEPENAARLTHKIMSGIQQEPAAHSWMDTVDNLLRKVVVRYSFSGLSLGLVLLFVTQFYQGSVQPSGETPMASEATVTLHSVAFKQTYSQFKDKYAECRSPFRPAETYRDCLLSKIK